MLSAGIHKTKLWIIERWRELARFGTVGLAAFVVDVTVFNVALFTPALAAYPIVCKTISVGVAMTFSWVANRYWTFSTRATANKAREFTSFVLVNLLGMLPSLLCLWVSHYLLDLTSKVADNISANIIGLAIGTILRYVCYRAFVFTGNRP